MADEHLNSVDELQSYMIHRIEKFLNDHGRKIIGWDEIIEGGLSPTATVMSWRGEEGGIKAVKAGNQAIMTPGKYCYLDAFQDAPNTQPMAIGGYLTLEKSLLFRTGPRFAFHERSRAYSRCTRKCMDRAHTHTRTLRIHDISSDIGTRRNQGGLLPRSKSGTISTPEPFKR